MKILQFGKFFPPDVGGIENVIYEITEGLSQKINCDVLCSNSKNKTVIEKKDKYTVIRTASLGKIFSTSISPAIICWLKKICNNYDLIHIHLPDPMASLAYFVVRPKTKLVIHWHSDIIKQKNLLIFYKPLQNWILKRANKILVTSPNLLEDSPFLKKFKEKCEIVPLFIDIEEFQARKVKKINFQNQNNKKIVLFVGRLVYYKGVEYLIRAMKEVDALLLIAGDGPLRGNLEKQVKELNLSNKVIFLGRLSDEEIKYCYQICNVFVLPSIENTEAFGLVQLEAMLSSKPVVNTNLPTGVPFVSKNQETGITVPSRDSKALAQAINTILNNPQLADEFGKNGVKRVNEIFSKEKNLEKILSIYNQVLNE